MQFGMPTLIEIKSIEECAALCKSLGLAFIELNMNLPEYQADRLDATALRQIANEYGIYYTIHLDENLNPCDFNDKVATAYTETVLQTIETAKQLGVPVLNMHMNPGVWFTLPDKKVFLFEEYKTEYLHKLAYFRDKCTVAVGNADIKICIENTRSFQLDFVEKSISRLLESPVFGLTFDIGHNAGDSFKQQPVIEHNINRLCHMHLHDYEKTRGDHLPLGEGELDLPKYLEIAKTHNCRVVLETKTIAGLKESVQWIRRKEQNDE
ncbi:MAG: hypothetical protein BGN88_10025 [Clostridiales bacterium 43-6]|nr:MAG: hypothetical protein BGN88_10025 [Clostridiales bacterium 43-6]